MITNDSKTSLMVPFQVPSFIRDNPDYANFIAFLQAYYEWTELSNTTNALAVTANSYNQGVTYGSKNIQSYQDIDSTLDDFLDYFTNQFMPYFPADALADERRALKYAKQLYETKGTPASYQFLFRLLYNSDFDYFVTSDVVLKASSGTWYVPKSLSLATTDERFLQLTNYRAFGETSKSFATIENSILAGGKIEVFISNIERLFQSGETIRIIDNKNQDVIIDGSNLTAVLVGQINQINISPNNRGTGYEVGDPVVIYGGLNTNITNPIGATATVGSVTTGSIQGINLVSGGFGYNSNTVIQFSNLNSGAQSPIAHVGSFNPAANVEANVNLIIADNIGRAVSSGMKIGNTQYYFANGAANLSTTFSNAFNYLAYTTYPISSVLVDNQGGGLSSIPTVSAISEYPCDVSGTYGVLSSLGILSPIQITNGGVGYEANDKIVFTGGRGLGAAANVLTVNSTGSILTVEYVEPTSGLYTLGGMGYTPDSIPTLTVLSANTNATGAALYVPGILGTGATFTSSVNRIGAITSIDISNYGEDYISAPSVSLKVEDIVVSNLTTQMLSDLESGYVVYQGTGNNSNSASYYAYYDSIEQLTYNNNEQSELWSLRVYNYNSTPNTQLTLKVGNTVNFFSNTGSDLGIRMNVSQQTYAANSFFVGSPAFTTDGIGLKIYGDGTAQANATFLNGLTIGAGQYIDNSGQPSGDDVLQSTDYNSFTYQITVEKEIAKYRDILLNLLHPAGMKVIGRYAISSNTDYNTTAEQSLVQGETLASYTGIVAANAVMSANFTNYSSNVITFNNLTTDTNIATFIFAGNSYISLSSSYGPNVIGQVTSVNSISNMITIDSSSWLTYGNVAYVSANSGSNVINILGVTGTYDIMNDGMYSNTSYPIMDIVYPGNEILIGSNTYIVTEVNAAANNITVSENITTYIANSLMTVTRSVIGGGTDQTLNQVIIYGPLGQGYVPELTDGYGDMLTTESGQILILG